MSKPPMSITVSRRPPWAKSNLRYNAVMNASARAGKPGEDYGVDNFSYDPQKVADWRMPETIIAENVPKDLFEVAKDWTLAGAALDTALERLQELNDEAVQRVNPRYTHEHLLASRRASEQLPSTGGASSEFSLTHSNAPGPLAPLSNAQPPKLDTSVGNLATKPAHPNQLPDSITSKPGMESPPFTPVTRSGFETGSGARSPAMMPHGCKDTPTTPDFVKLSAQLSPLMSPSQYSFTSTSSSAGSAKLDTLSWNNYLNAYTSELDDLKKCALPRVKGYEKVVTKTLAELRSSPPKGISWQTAEAVYAFAEWWKEAKNMVKERERTVSMQMLPRAEEVVGGA